MDEKVTESASPIEKSKAILSSDPWASLKFYTDLTPTTPPISTDPTGLLQPNFLYRGRVNYFSKFNKELDSPERTRSIQQELRTLVARWLKMQNVSVLLGAGASKYATGFVASGLFDHLSALISTRPSAVTLKAFINYVSKTGEVGKRFEEFLAQISILVRVLDPKQWPIDKLPFSLPVPGLPEGKSVKDHLADLLLDLERGIAILCNVPLPPSPLVSEAGELTPHEAFLAKLVSRDPQQARARIFTTNYDTLLEQAMDRLGIFYSDGFSGTVFRRFNPAAYDLDLHYPGDVTEGRVRRYDKVLQLFKLHGSITWRRSELSAGNPFGIGFELGPLPSSTAVAAEPALFDQALGKGQRLAILPTAAKYGETLAMPFAHLFRSMGQAFREPQTVLFVLGYSGWDAHINRVIEDALTNPGFTCVLVDPAPSAWAINLTVADYGGRVYCFGGEWGKFEFFAKEVMPDIEVLKTELEIAKTLRQLRRTDAKVVEEPTE